MKSVFNGTGIFFKELVFYYECYFDDPLLPYHAHQRKDVFVQFCHDNTVDIHYNVRVDNVISIVVHNNHWWYCMLNDDSKYVMYYFNRVV